RFTFSRPLPTERGLRRPVLRSAARPSFSRPLRTERGLRRPVLRSAARPSELDLRYCLRALFGLEELTGREVEHACEQVARERLDLRVELLNAVVVVLPRVRDAILRRGQL